MHFVQSADARLYVKILFCSKTVQSNKPGEMELFYLLHSNFITYIGYRCAPGSSLNCQHCVFDHERWTSYSTFSKLHSYQPLRLFRSSTQDLLTIYRCKTVFGRRRFTIAAPQELRNCETLGTLKSILRLTYSDRTFSSQLLMRPRLQFYKLNSGTI